MNKRILVADDSITIQKFVGITLAQEEVDILFASNGRDAWEKAKSKKPDIVLADHQLPEEDGFALCRKIKDDPQLKSAVCFIIYGIFEEFDKERFKQSGADSTIVKPFESKRFIEIIQSQLKRSLTVEVEEERTDHGIPVQELPSQFLEEINEEAITGIAFKALGNPAAVELSPKPEVSLEPEAKPIDMTEAPTVRVEASTFVASVAPVDLVEEPPTVKLKPTENTEVDEPEIIEVEAVEPVETSFGEMKTAIATPRPLPLEGPHANIVSMPVDQLISLIEGAVRQVLHEMLPNTVEQIIEHELKKYKL